MFRGLFFKLIALATLHLLMASTIAFCMDGKGTDENINCDNSTMDVDGCEVRMSSPPKSWYQTSASTNCFPSINTPGPLQNRSPNHQSSPQSLRQNNNDWSDRYHLDSPDNEILSLTTRAKFYTGAPPLHTGNILNNSLESDEEESEDASNETPDFWEGEDQFSIYPEPQEEWYRMHHAHTNWLQANPHAMNNQ